MKPDKDGMFFSCLPSSVLQVKLLHLASPPDAMEKHSPTARGRLPPFVFMPVGEHERISMATNIVAVTFSWNSCFLSFFLVRTQPAISSLASSPPPSHHASPHRPQCPPPRLIMTLLLLRHLRPFASFSIAYLQAIFQRGTISRDPTFSRMGVSEESHVGPH